jgi:hypothetical protein
MNKLTIPKLVPGAPRPQGLMTPLKRGTFLRYLGVSAAATGLLLAGCSDDDDDKAPSSVDLGSGDTGILNYAYLLEQLEAAFYVKVISSPYSNMPAEEKTLLTEIRDHELAHRDFFKAALGSAAISGSVEFDFSTVDFTSRASVLATAKAYEDLGVSAYNGAGVLLESADLLLIAGKIVSVEARHASAIRDLISPYTAAFSGDDVVTASNGLDQARLPSAVLAIAGTYVKTTVVFDNLPS